MGVATTPALTLTVARSHTRLGLSALFTVCVGIALYLVHARGYPLLSWLCLPPAIVALLDQARERGLPVDFDCYPYTAYCCGLLEIFPPWAKDQGPQAMIRVLADATLRRRVEREMTRPPFDWETPWRDWAGTRSSWPVSRRRRIATSTAGTLRLSPPPLWLPAVVKPLNQHLKLTQLPRLQLRPKSLWPMKAPKPMTSPLCMRLKLAK